MAASKPGPGRCRGRPIRSSIPRSRARPLHVGQHRRAARRGADLRQRRREHALDRRIPRARPRRPRARRPAAALLLRPERPADAPLRGRLPVPRRPLRLPPGRAGVARLGGLHRLRRSATHLRTHPQAGGPLHPLLPASAVPDAGGRRDGSRHDRLGAARVPAGEALRDVWPDGGHRATLVPAAGACGGEAGLHRDPDPRGRPARGG